MHRRRVLTDLDQLPDDERVAGEAAPAPCGKRQEAMDCYYEALLTAVRQETPAEIGTEISAAKVAPHDKSQISLPAGLTVRWDVAATKAKNQATVDLLLTAFDAGAISTETLRKEFEDDAKFLPVTSGVWKGWPSPEALDIQAALQPGGEVLLKNGDTLQLTRDGVKVVPLEARAKDNG